MEEAEIPNGIPGQIKERERALARSRVCGFFGSLVSPVGPVGESWETQRVHMEMVYLIHRVIINVFAHDQFRSRQSIASIALARL